MNMQAVSTRGRAGPTIFAYPSQRLMHVLLLTPPMTQLNTPYPATAYLMGFLRQHATRLDLEVMQADAALEKSGKGQASATRGPSRDAEGGAMNTAKPRRPVAG